MPAPVRAAVGRDDPRRALQFGNDHDVLGILDDLNRQDVQHPGRKTGRQAHRARLVVTRITVPRPHRADFRRRV